VRGRALCSRSACARLATRARGSRVRQSRTQRPLYRPGEDQDPSDVSPQQRYLQNHVSDRSDVDSITALRKKRDKKFGHGRHTNTVMEPPDEVRSAEAIPAAIAEILHQLDEGRSLEEMQNRASSTSASGESTSFIRRPMMCAIPCFEPTISTHDSLVSHEFSST
jgi:hypothetical protein